MTSSRLYVYDVLDDERDYQNFLAQKAHGDPNNDFGKPLESFVLYMESYLTELREQLARTWGPTSYDKARHTLRKLTAIGVAAMEAHGAVPRDGASAHPEIGV